MLFGWLRRPAEYARAYLTASLTHQLQLQAARTAEIGARVSRLEALDGRLAEVLAESLAETRALALRLDDVERRQSTQGESLQRLHAAAEAQHQLGEHHIKLTEAQTRLGEHHAKQGETQVQLSQNQTRLIEAQIRLGQKLVEQQAETSGHAIHRLDTLLGVVGPRLDELDIKTRPLIPIDEESWAARVADGYIMLPRAEGVFTVMVANAGSGGLEPGVRQVLRALLPPGAHAADVGANVGLLTLAMATAVGPAGRVWAFEPEARARRQLEKTLHLNGLRQVTLSASAVGAEAGRLTFHESPVIGHSSLYALPDAEEAAATLVEVPVVRLDDEVPAGERLDVVKIDVEGAELDVLRGMDRLLRANPDLAVVAEYGPSHLERVGIAPADWFGAFAAYGLEPRLIGEPDGATSPTDAAALAQVESANLVFVRPGGAADGRLPR